MENSFFARNPLLLKVDFFVQIILIGLSSSLIFFGLVMLGIGSEMRFVAFIFLLYLQIFIGVFQFLSAISRFLDGFPNLSNYRKIHFFMSVLVLVLLFFSDPGDGSNSIILWSILWTKVLVLPQILMYVYFWITWNEYKKVS